jgi:hypothetical protein
MERTRTQHGRVSNTSESVDEQALDSFGTLGQLHFKL